MVIGYVFINLKVANYCGLLQNTKGNKKSLDLFLRVFVLMVE